MVSNSLPFVATYQAGAVLEALGDPTRRTIFEMLGEQPHAVGELARRLPISRPAVSQHLKVLKRAGMVIDRPRGTQRIYEIDRDGLASLRTYFDQIWTNALDAFKHAAEVAAKEDS
jgi:DNA-binding transcriptional ArsR family regulator